VVARFTLPQRSQPEKKRAAGSIYLLDARRLIYTDMNSDPQLRSSAKASQPTQSTSGSMFLHEPYCYESLGVPVAPDSVGHSEKVCITSPIVTMRQPVPTASEPVRCLAGRPPFAGNVIDSEEMAFPPPMI